MREKLPGPFVLGCLLLATPALAVTDEIQVYTGDIEAPGVFGLTWHNNYTPDGLKTPDFPGGLVDNHAYSSVTEWAYGVTDWFEAGLYLPLYANTADQGWTYNGFKLRALFVQPDNARQGFLLRREFRIQLQPEALGAADQYRRDPPHHRLALRRRHRWSFTFNPIVDNNYRGGIAGWNSCRRRGWTMPSTRAGPWRRRSMTISASCAASCPPATSRTNYGRWRITPAIPFPSKPAPASA